MSRTIALVTRQTSPDSDTSITELTNTILDDFALANRLLRMVNTVFYIKYQIGGKITTVSRAVYVLGFHQVRDAALSLMLFEHLKDRNLAMDLKESFIMSFVSGVISRELAKNLRISELEEAFICAMFHELGKFLVMFYLPSEYEKIKALATSGEISEEVAASSILNTGYAKIGIKVASHWNFSDHIIYCMERFPLSSIPKPVNTLDTMRCLSIFSNKLCSLINQLDSKPETWKKALVLFTQNFGKCFHVTQEQLKEVLDSSLQELTAYADNFKFNVNQSPFLRRLIYFLKGGEMPLSEPSRVVAEPIKAPIPIPMQVLYDIDDSEEDGTSKTPEDILTKGILEIANILLEPYSINDIMRIILEILYRGMEFTRVIICIKSTKGQYMEGRFGFGPNIESIVKRFSFYMNKDYGDIFNVSLFKDSTILVNDVNDPAVVACIPDWLKELLNVDRFILIPITVKGIPISLIYGDWFQAENFSVDQKRLRYLKTLRNQAILAFKQLK